MHFIVFCSILSYLIVSYRIFLYYYQGRLGKLLYVPLPSGEDRVSILKAVSRNVSIYSSNSLLPSCTASLTLSQSQSTVHTVQTENTMRENMELNQNSIASSFRNGNSCYNSSGRNGSSGSNGSSDSRGNDGTNRGILMKINQQNYQEEYQMAI